MDRFLSTRLQKTKVPVTKNWQILPHRTTLPLYKGTAFIQKTQYRQWRLLAANSTHCRNTALFCTPVIVMTALCSFSGGYDIRPDWDATVNGPCLLFRDAFNPSNSAKATGLLFSIYPLGQLPGSLAASAICDRWGRRSAMFVGSIMVIIATAILTTSHTLGQFLAGRFLLGAGVSFTDIAAPTYCIEIAPSQWKGRMTGFYNINTHFPYSGHLGVVALSDTSLLPQWQGYSASTQVWGTSIIQTNWSWRIPLIIQIIPAFIVAIAVWFCPESPRWLYIHGTEEQAYQILIRYHGNDDPNDAMVALEMSEFTTKIHTGDAHKRWWDFTPLFKTRNARWRSLMVIMMAFFVQFSGAGLGSISAAVSGSAICLALNAGFSAKWASYGNGPKDLRGMICAVGIAAVSAFFLFSNHYIVWNAWNRLLVQRHDSEGSAYDLAFPPLRDAILSLHRCRQLSSTLGASLAYMLFPLVLKTCSGALLKDNHLICPCITEESHTVAFPELDDIFNEKNPVKASQFKRKATVSGR
ncbi:general substrate transporter [Hysterangium stoloniferum]|nr:general substrate transporter [Hysterangium stoloniferum]